MAGVYVCERDGEVNKVKIKVVKTPVCELFLRRCFGLHLGSSLSRRDLESRENAHMIMSVECVPELKINLAQIADPDRGIVMRVPWW
jgi:hypothetical protein